MSKLDSNNNLEKQQAICLKYRLAETEPDEMIAVAIQTIGKTPIYGTRIEMPERGNISWFIHCGEHSDAIDFYQPIHTEHLNELLPLVINYLRLPACAKFIIDDQGYEDVWLQE